MSFRSALGSTNRPFAGPGEFVELRLRRDDSGCDAASPGFDTNLAGQIVTALFTPATGSPRAVVMSTDCSFFAGAVRASCESALGGAGTAECVQVTPTTDLRVTEFSAIDETRLQVRFPDTGVLAWPNGYDPNASGPVKIIVTRSDQPLPCGLAEERCAESLAQPGLIACVDELYEADGTCRTSALLVDETFPHFTALPPANDFAASCFRDEPCAATAMSLAVAVDRAGNLLLPVHWEGILVQSGGIPVPRLVEARLESPLPFSVPAQQFVGSYTPAGGRLPPIFEPQFASGEVVTLFGSADAARTVLRFARQQGTCAGGSRDGELCASRANCPGGSCATSCVADRGILCTSDAQCAAVGGSCGTLFDFAPFAIGGGPVRLPRGLDQFCQLDATQSCSSEAECPGLTNACVSYALEARTPVPLEGLGGSEDLLAFAVSEPIANQQLNDDVDETDLVMTLRDRATGQPLAIGEDGTTGRAVAALRDGPFRFPAFAAAGDVVAFLEPEALEGEVAEQDKNDDGDAFDTILRVFRRDGGTTAIEVTASLAPPVAADAALVVEGRSVAISDGDRVFFRAREAAAAAHTTTRVSVAIDGSEANGFSTWPSLSADGQVVAFHTRASNLILPELDDNNGCQAHGYAPAPGTGTENCIDTYVRDRLAGTTNRVSIAAGGVQPNSYSHAPVITRDGRYVFFETQADNLTFGYFGNKIFRYDRSISTLFPEGRIGLAPLASSDDGRFVAYFHYFDVITMIDDNQYDVFVHDAQLGHLAGDILVSENFAETGPGDLGSDTPSVSPDGRYVAFHSHDTNLLATPVLTQGLYLRDLETNSTRMLVAGPCFPGGFSSDGRYLVFQSSQPNLDPADVAGAATFDTFVYDFVTARVELVSRASAGPAGDLSSGNGRISDEGRYVAFLSDASNLVPGDNAGFPDIFMRDRLTGLTTRVSVADDGSEAQGASGIVGFTDNRGGNIGISADGTIVAFASDASNLLGPGADMNGVSDVFVREPDPADVARSANLTGDDDLRDAVLGVIDAAGTPPSAPTWLCPAGAAAVADGRVAFLRPEADGPTPSLPLCPAGESVGDGGVDLNQDGDAGDEVVHLWTGSGQVDNLDLAATAVDLSASTIAAIAGTTRVRPLGAGAWIDTGLPATAVAIAGPVVAMITPESLLGVDLDGDDDQDDQILQIADATTGASIAAGDDLGRSQPATEMVVGEEAIAFRTREAELCGASCADCDLNQDGDCSDDVLQGYDVLQGRLVNTRQQVFPCSFAACDPRLPYRVSAATLRFLTDERQQNCSAGPGCVLAEGARDLNGDGDALDLVLQTFNLRTAEVRVIATIEDPTSAPEQSDPLADGSAAGAGPDETDGSVVFLSRGVCVETVGACATSSCAPGASCRAGLCEREQGVCVPGSEEAAATCPGAAVCRPDFIVPASADSDLDGVADVFDNCALDANADQADVDGDGVGDLCENLDCSGGVAVENAKLVIAGLQKAIGEQRISLAAELVLGPGEPAGFATLGLDTRGAQVLIEDLGAGEAPLLDLTLRSTPVPAGGPGPSSCDTARKDGWRKNRKSTVYTYRNGANALPSSCVAGSAQGLRTLRLLDKREDPRARVELQLLASDATIPAVTGPLRVTFALSASAAEVASGACGQHEFLFGDCSLDKRSTKLTCK